MFGNVMFDYAIIGNGLLGASAAEYLTRQGHSVCVAGAAYGAGGRYFSSHEDESRIYRTWHADKYWETLSIANHRAMQALEAESGIKVFSARPVYYDFHDPAFARAGQGTPYLHHNGFGYQDRQGGVIHPRRYIDAMNLVAAKSGARFRQGVVSEVAAIGAGYRLWGLDRPILAHKVIDTRGIHMAHGHGLRVQGKILLFAIHDAPQDSHCFVKTGIGSDVFKDLYACATVGYDEHRAISKFGFSERQPVYLDTDEALSHWFQGGYRDYPHLAEAKALIEAAGYDQVHRYFVRPCAFATTDNARPQVRLDDGYLSVGGCNGMAAKCSQALMASILDDYGF
jgi:glycine/D-amino acid oxidase-like deaminating enzyme